MSEQLAFDDPRDRLHRSSVIEPSMTAAERDAIVSDAIEQIALMRRARPCRCIGGSLRLDELDQCWRCGREVA